MIEESDIVPLLEPREGIPPVVNDTEGLAEAIRALAAGTGPVAVDAERASGYRYSGRAYLVQLRRAGSGTVLIDPIGLPGLGELAAALDGAEIVLHAATQDLPCLTELDFRPKVLFDTELAGRLLGYERVGLGTMVETVLGFRLAEIIGGAVVIETVFSLPGLGPLMVQSVLGSDVPVILGIVVLTMLWVALFNLLTDLSYLYLNPKART